MTARVHTLRCDQIIASLSDASAGPTYSVSALATALAELGCETSLLTLTGWRGNSPAPPLPGVRLQSYPLTNLPMFRGVASSTALRRSLESRSRTTDIFHTHGLWLMPNVYPTHAAARKGARAKVVHSPRGMLGADALRFSATKKWMFMKAFQRRALERADCIHATADSELAEIRRLGLRNPVAVIPNGVDLPAQQHRSPERGRRVLLSLGRLHPKKGLDRLIEAWAKLEPETMNWRLRIVGPSEQGYGDVLRDLVRSTGATGVTIEPPLHGEAKSQALFSAELFVLPSLNENFAMTVAEALAHGVPVISSRGAPWSGLEVNGCGWWIDHGAAPLRDALAHAMSLPPQRLSAMGVVGRAWVAREYSWRNVGEQMQAIYRWLVEGGQRPTCVDIG